MKYLILISFLFSNIIYAQNKYDNIWKLGYSGDNGKIKNGISLDFRHDPPLATLDYLTVGYSATMASLCNKEGDLICHSRGFWLEDASGDTIPGSLNLVCHTDESFIPYILKHGTYGAFQANIMLPTPEKENKEFFVFNFINDTIRSYANDFAYARCNFTNKNIVTVLEKCHNATNAKQFQPGNISACRHGNGRDWWIFAVEFDYRKGHIFLFTKDGIVQDNVFDITGAAYDPFDSGVTCFTNDGKKLAIYNHLNGLWIYDFNRCNGTVSNFRNIDFKGEKEEIAHNSGMGIANSPDSRYLYVSRTFYLYQFDLHSPNIAESKTLITQYDPNIDMNLGIPNAFNQLQLAPNNKIYMSLMSGEDFLHTIEKPNEKGVACDFKRRSQYLPALHAFALPNYPNFNLGKLVGSPCDTVSVATKDIKPEDFGIKLFPNPSSTIIKIDITLPQYDPTIKTEVVVVDVSGAIVMRYMMPDFAYIAELDISKLPSGVYGVQLRQPQKSGTRVLATEKLVVIAD